jgi:hypothetical protein
MGVVYVQLLFEVASHLYMAMSTTGTKSSAQ